MQISPDKFHLQIINQQSKHSIYAFSSYPFADRETPKFYTFMYLLKLKFIVANFICVIHNKLYTFVN